MNILANKLIQVELGKAASQVRRNDNSTILGARLAYGENSTIRSERVDRELRPDNRRFV